jgi:hypothetical protein
MRLANTKCLGMLIDGHAQKTGIRKRMKRSADTSMLIVMNSFEGPVDFTLPKIESGGLVIVGGYQHGGLQVERGFRDRQHVPGDWPVIAVCRQYGITHASIFEPIVVSPT